MIEYVSGDMFKSDADCLINTVNCEGFMGKGIAYQFKLKFPENNKDYVNACKRGDLRIGKLHFFFENGKTIINFPTKDKWREKSLISYIVKGLDELTVILPKLNVKKIAMPPLGCGNGGLNWGEVKPIIEERLKIYEEKYIFEIYEPSKEYRQVATVAPKLSVSSLAIMDIKMKLDSVTELRLQKAAFFTNIFMGEEYFKFDKYKFGPYSYAISLVAKSIGEFQKFYSVGETQKTYDMVYQMICSDKTTKKLEKLLPAINKATLYINKIKDNKDVEGIATTMYLVLNNSELNQEKLITSFKSWSEDKSNRFSEIDIIKCIDYLENTNMISKNILGNYRTNV